LYNWFTFNSATETRLGLASTSKRRKP